MPLKHMTTKNKVSLISIGLILILMILSSCSSPLDWPDSPLYDLSQSVQDSTQYPDLESAKQAIVGHYAHYDIVAYEDPTTKTPMNTFIISYGFSDFYLDGGKLMQSDKFVHAEQKINQKNVYPTFRDEAIQAIEPRIQEVELSFHDGKWQLYRPATPVLLGITGDPSKPLSKDPNDPNLIDPDKDGHPGVTVEINIGNIIKGELYITRREIYSNYLTLNQDGALTGYVVDRSEQFVIGASLKILEQPSNSIQNPDMGLNPVILIPVSYDIDTPEELMALRDELFPPEPGFINAKK
ncbi:MAG: hypothetical protein K9N05_01285 [Candidatus Marinimicrobia bacterium]|nr:hypothetical protein [Candidatus Neomarinimicrobiota bacterium]